MYEDLGCTVSGHKVKVKTVFPLIYLVLYFKKGGVSEKFSNRFDIKPKTGLVY